jgi:amino acid transporter
MGRWTLAALVVNAVVGSGIFGLPSVIASLVGPRAPWAWVAGAAGNGVVMLCFAEVASRFSEAGGAYLYARESLPRLIAIQVGWLVFLTRVTAAAAAANLFTVNLAELVPAVEGQVVRVGLLTVLIGGLAVVNFRGVRNAARLSNVFTIGKLVPLAVFLAAGAYFMATREVGAAPASAAARSPDWLRAILLVAFAYGGYDGTMLAMSEARQPRRDAPFAMIAAMLLLVAIYTGVQLVVGAALADPAASSRPLVSAARVFMGPFGGALLAAGAMISVFGFLVANFLAAPRLLYALGTNHDLPPLFGRIHPRFRTPHVSIVTFGLLVWALAAYGSFQANAMLSAVSRLFVYGSTCVALIVLRKRRPGEAWLRLPAGVPLALAGIGFCALLASRMVAGEIGVLLAVALIALLHWSIVRRTSLATGGR